MTFFRAATLAALISLAPVSGAAKASIAGFPDAPIYNYALLFYSEHACASKFRVDQKHLDEYRDFTVLQTWDPIADPLGRYDQKAEDAYKAMGQEAFCSAVYELFNLATGTRAPKAIRSL